MDAALQSVNRGYSPLHPSPVAPEPELFSLLLLPTSCRPPPPPPPPPLAAAGQPRAEASGRACHILPHFRFQKPPNTMSIVARDLYVCSPNPTRGTPLHIGTDAKTNRIVYVCGKLVVLRSLADPLKAEVYGEHAYPPSCAKVSPSGNYVCSADISGNIRIWALDNAERTLQLETKPLAGKVHDICWSFDSQRIAVVGEGREKFAHVFSWNTGTTVGELSGHTATVLSVDMRPQRPFRIATGAEDNAVNFFEAFPAKFSKSYRSFTKYVNVVRFSPDGSLLAAAGGDYAVVLLDGKTGDALDKQFPKDQGHKGSIFSLAWSPDGSKLLTASGDRTVKIWDVTGRQLLRTINLHEGGGVLAAAGAAASSSSEIRHMQMACAWLDQTAISVSLSGDINLLNTADPTLSSLPVSVISGHRNPISALAVLPDGSNRFVSGSTDGVLNIWQLGTGCLGRIVPAAGGTKDEQHSNAVTGMSVDPNSLHIVTCSMDDSLRMSSPLEMSYLPSAALVGIQGTPCGLARAAGTGLAAVVTSRSILLVDTASPHDMSVVLDVVVGYEPSCVSMVSATSANVLVAVGSKKDNSIHVYGVVQGSSGEASLAERCVLHRHRGPVSALAFSPQASGQLLLASGDANREVIVWDLWEVTTTTAAATATGGRAITSGWVFHNSRVSCLCWSPSGRRLVSGSLDRSLIVWDAEGLGLVDSGSAVHHVSSRVVATAKNAHVEGVTCAVFVGEGTLVSGGADCCLRSWSVE